MVKKVLIITGIVAVVAAIFFVVTKKENKIEWRTVQVDKGDLVVGITATGTVNPRQSVQVGTQVSGTVAKIYADFNSHVKKGQVIAVLDTTFLRASVDDAQAALEKSQAQLKLSLQTRNRTKALFDKGLAAQADLDLAEADYTTAVATQNSSEASLKRAKINLKYATILSPIDGVVINRNVEVGQTVAASLNTPTLFIIADDLSQMQVQVSVDEGDIGSVKVDQKATFTVDAFPDRTFEGVVSQIRLQPVTSQNVVSYTVMLDVKNNDQTLLPGMTANVTVISQSYNDVLKVPSSALKFIPPLDYFKNLHKGGHLRKDGTDTLKTGRRQGKWGGERPPSIFVLENNMPRRVMVKVIGTNGSETAVEADLEKGQEVIVGTLNGKQTQPAQNAAKPFGMSNAGQMGGGNRGFR